VTRKINCTSNSLVKWEQLHSWIEAVTDGGGVRAPNQRTSGRSPNAPFWPSSVSCVCRRIRDLYCLYRDSAQAAKR